MAARTCQILDRAEFRPWLLWTVLQHMPALRAVLENSLRILKFICGETWKAKAYIHFKDLK